MKTYFKSTLLFVAVGAALYGCGQDTSSLDTSSANPLPAAQPVAVAPQAVTQAAKLDPEDLVFAPAPEQDANLAVALPSLHVIPMTFNRGDSATPFAGTSPTGYSPKQVRHAYGADTLPNQGLGQTIAIVDAYGSPTIKSDLATFSTANGLPQATLTIAYQGGAPTATDAGWALETSLDVEWAHALAPQAKILLVVAHSSGLSDLLASTDYAASQRASQVSMSWGAGEFSSQGYYDSHFNKSGVSFFASAGDSGAAMNWPAVSPYVTSVGGTNLSLDASGNVLGETTWTGSGGGRSAYSAAPSYQKLTSAMQTLTRGYRCGPDVAYDGDPSTGFMVYDSTTYNGLSGWFQVGGTSAGAPQWAALAADFNSQRAAYGRAPLAGLNPTLYTLPASDFNDITAGSNGAFSATSGYDLTTGLGSPRSSPLFNAFVNK